eukprot:TRINITY_DN850_c0_g1_i3.p1 TRINITY_DN850_c0_g1~~TRINITY_DN850_c0_g1_i3.p1  ORF type:complete len:363 (+),score=114.96 TRINITY_DN850_c0_g1_i3:92-1180(+)
MAHFPPGAYPPGAFPPGGFPPGGFPPGGFPPGGFPPGAYPPGAYPPGAYPQHPPVKRAQIAYFDDTKSEWWVSGDNKSFGEAPTRQFTVSIGKKGDIPLPGNYAGDGIRLAFYRPSDNTWHVKGLGTADWDNSAGNVTFKFGQKDDIPVPGDYAGDGITRFALFRPAEGNWYIKGPGLNDWEKSQGNYVIQTGGKGDIPLPADYVGARKTQVAVYRPSSKQWFIKGPDNFNWNTSQGNQEFKFGPKDPKDVPVPADYFGEGKVRAAFYDDDKGVFTIKGAGFANYDDSQGNLAIQTGGKGDIPVPADYFGEGKARIAVYRPSQQTWYIKGPGFADWNGSPNNASIKWGKSATDKPVPYAYFF